MRCDLHTREVLIVVLLEIAVLLCLRKYLVQTLPTHAEGSHVAHPRPRNTALCFIPLETVNPDPACVAGSLRTARFSSIRSLGVWPHEFA